MQTISHNCYRLNDDIRWIVGLQLATGARLAEVVGLRKEDILVDQTSIPFVFIRQHLKLGRTLKTPGSERKVPLLGLGLWAAQQAMAADNNSDWLFPRYAKAHDIRATHASNTINKWFRESLHIEKTSHSFRHAMRDLLRNSGCPEAVAKRLLGHGTKTVSESYGQGYQLPILHDALKKALGLVTPDISVSLDDLDWSSLQPPDPKKRLPI